MPSGPLLREPGGIDCRRTRPLPCRSRDTFRTGPGGEAPDLALQLWGGLDSNQRPTDYESRQNRSSKPNLAW
jgi:hypothetical protein